MRVEPIYLFVSFTTYDPVDLRTANETASPTLTIYSPQDITEYL